MDNKTESLLRQVSDLGTPELRELIKRANIRLRFLKRQEIDPPTVFLNSVTSQEDKRRV